MSLEQKSHTSTQFELQSNSRTSFLDSNSIHVFNPSDASSTPKQQDGSKPPLEAALGVKLSYVATVHESLIKFLDNLAKKTITLFSDYFYKDVKFQANCSDHAYLPKFIKQIGRATLQSLDENTECKDFKTLQLKLLPDLKATRQRITIKYFLQANNLHRLALKRRFQLSICRLLTSAALGSIAETDIKTTPNMKRSPSFLLVNPIAKASREFILLYKRSAQTQICSSSNHRAQSP